MDRKSFLKKISAAFLLGVPLVSLWNCSDDDGDDGSGSGGGINCIDNGTGNTISENHDHSFSVPKEDVSAGIEKTYDITGDADHPHEVTVTEGHFAVLQSNQSVLIESTSDAGHSHDITIFCQAS